MIRLLRSPVWLLCAAALAAQPLEKPAPNMPAAVFNFDRDPAGQPPAHFVAAVTGGSSGALWEVTREWQPYSRPHALAQKGQVGGGNGALLLLKDYDLKDGDVSVRFKLVGEADYQAVGFVFRYQDTDNFYLMLADSKEDSCSLFLVKNGKKKLLDTKSVMITPGVWHSMRLVFRVKEHSVFFDGELTMGGQGALKPAHGQVGLWTSGDTQAAFDDFTVVP